MSEAAKPKTPETPETDGAPDVDKIIEYVERLPTSTLILALIAGLAVGAITVYLALTYLRVERVEIDESIEELIDA